MYKGTNTRYYGLVYYWSSKVRSRKRPSRIAGACAEVPPKAHLKLEEFYHLYTPSTGDTVYPVPPRVSHPIADQFLTLYCTERYDEARSLLPSPNIPLLRKGLEWVEEQAALPYHGSWDQESWVRSLTPGESSRRGCGTAYCYAGYVTQTVYPEFAHTHVIYLDYNRYETNLVAQALLGLTDEHMRLGLVAPGGSGYGLFYGQNTAPEIRAICEFTAGEPL